MGLTPREERIMELREQGHGYKAIAQMAECSPGYVVRVTNMYGGPDLQLRANRRTAAGSKALLDSLLAAGGHR